MQPVPATAANERLRRVRRAVRELVAEQGLRFSMDAVAARAGCSKQTLYAQFGSRQELLRRVVQEHLDQATTRLQDGNTELRAALIAFAGEHLQRLSDPEVLASCRLIDAEARQFPDETRTLFHDGHGRMLERLAARLQLAMRRGQLRHDDPHFAAELLLGMIVGSDVERRRFAVPHRSTNAARQQWVEFAVDAFLRAFAPVATPMSIRRP